MAVAVAVGCLSRVAAAEEPSQPFEAWARRPFAADLNLALASPLGLLGASLEYAPIRYVSLGGGVGTSLDGPQLAALCRARFYESKVGAFFFGGGYSQGPYRQTYANRYGVLSLAEWLHYQTAHDSRPPSRYWRTARWLNLDAGWELRRQDGVDVRAFGGVELLLNRHGDQVQQHDADNPPKKLVPWVVYVGAAFGYSL